MTAIRKELESLVWLRGTVDSHPGLLLQRYLHQWATGDQGKPEEKRDLLQAAIQASQNGDTQAIYKIAYERWESLLPVEAAKHELRTQGRLIVGLGTENVLETGIRLHHTYGMPILPGSALKGLCSHYCHRSLGATNEQYLRPSPEQEKAYRAYLDGKQDSPPPNFHRLLFGNTDDGGCIIFHDAWFVPGSDPKPLKLDVMTPHHPKWLDGKVAPTDFDSPVPVPFLSVSGSFLMAVSWRGPASPQAGPWTKRAFDILVRALEHEGIGGKTSSGYGRLVEPPPPPPPPPPQPPRKRKSGDRARVIISKERPKGGFDVQDIETDRSPGTLTVGSPPAGTSTSIGAEVDVLVHNDEPRQPQYKWPQPAKKK